MTKQKIKIMKAFIQQLTTTQSATSPFILRLIFAIVLWPHGAQLLLGLFGGPGYANSMAMFGMFGLPSIVSFLVIFLQFFGSLFILLGLFTRLATAATIILFIGMIVKAHLSFGFFMDWTGTLQGEGFEYHILAIGILVSLTITGAGKYSIDGWISKQRKEDRLQVTMTGLSA
jgi:putative oxidoreductase